MKHRNTPKKTTTTNWKRDKKDRIRWHRQREREREVYWKSIVYCTGIGIVCNCMHKHQEFESNQRMNVAVVAITSALCTVWTCFALFQFSSLYVVCVLFCSTQISQNERIILFLSFGVRTKARQQAFDNTFYYSVFVVQLLIVCCGSMVSACHLIIFAILKQFRRKTEWIKVAFGLLAASWLENHTKECNIVMVCISVLATKFKLHAVCTIQQTNIEMSECNTRLEWVNETENRNVYDQVLNQIARTHTNTEKNRLKIVNIQVKFNRWQQNWKEAIM